MTQRLGNPIYARMEQINERIRAGKESGIYPYMQIADEIRDGYVTIDGHQLLQLSSYAYLDLLNHPKVRQAAQSALTEFGTGTQGARFLSGTTRIHTELEKTIAQFKKTDEAMVFPSGYVTNLGTISALAGRNDVVICDKLNHASIMDGCALSRAKFVRYEHNDMEDLEKVLAEAPKNCGKLIVVDAVFSMEGDIVNLPEVIRLSRKYDAILMVDEAHATGVLGETGHGIEEHFGIDDRDAIGVRMGTLSKAISSLGGYIAGSSKLITYLKHTARSFIFSAALPPALVAAAKASFEVIAAEPERVKKLRDNTNYFIQGLAKRGFPTANLQTPIVPIIIGDDERALIMAKALKDEGVFVLPVLSPAVPSGSSRIRATITSGHSFDQLEFAITAFEKVAKHVGILPG
ncbi:MAG: pyridoxal phosphate-dependent aminotransferase family protein [Candidatus Omnitrophica bacterium]|nr:pyridoxal phosphate-dependent aminotransferase family protein [Candidatus Omnitrophota bacterium]MDD5672461.1 pyridoxal phosphate-dependent aminotransferase family protein [Candidatus Omnitrophota bacterium]